MDATRLTLYNYSMKFNRILVPAFVVGCVVFPFATNAVNWYDEFAQIKILYGDEIEQGKTIQTNYGRTLNMRVVLDDVAWQEFFRYTLRTYVVSNTADTAHLPKITQHINIKNQANLQEFELYIPPNFDENGYERKSSGCSSFVVRVVFNKQSFDHSSNDVSKYYDILGEMYKERKVIACAPFKLPTPTPTPSETPSPTPILSILPTPTPAVSPTPSPEIINNQQSENSGSNESSNFNGIGSGAVAACSRTILGQGIKAVVMAIPIVGMAPIAFSLLNMTAAVFTVDRRRPEHWVKVVDAVTGKPVGGAIINIITPDGKVRATWKTDDKTGNTGDLLQPGQYEFVVQKTGFVFPSVEEPMFPLQTGEFVYRSGLINLNQSNMHTNG